MQRRGGPQQLIFLGQASGVISCCFSKNSFLSHGRLCNTLWTARKDIAICSGDSRIPMITGTVHMVQRHPSYRYISKYTRLCVYTSCNDLTSIRKELLQLPAWTKKRSATWLLGGCSRLEFHCFGACGLVFRACVWSRTLL